MTRPLIQIDDEVREMTEEEYAEFIALQEQMPSPFLQTDE